LGEWEKWGSFGLEVPAPEKKKANSREEKAAKKACCRIMGVGVHLTAVLGQTTLSNNRAKQIFASGQRGGRGWR